MAGSMDRTVCIILPFGSDRFLHQCISCGGFAKKPEDIKHYKHCKFDDDKETTAYRSNTLITHLEGTKSQVYDHIAIMNSLPMGKKRREAAQEKLDEAITPINEAIWILQKLNYQ